MTASLLLAVVLAAQGQGPTVMLSVDRDRVAPGDVVTLTIRTVSPLPDPIRLDLPSLGGFELEARAERSEVTPGPAGGGGRTSTVELHLRAVAPGEWRLGPISVRQGIAFAVADPVSVTILGGTPAAVSAGISQRAARLLERAPPPSRLGDAAVSVVLSDSSVATGEQVDVLTIAWFERGVRQRLRRAPSLDPPQLEGLWSYAQPVPVGIAATRTVNGRLYDLFLRHQIAFPLGAGTLDVPPARLSYSVPLSLQFFSQEERFELSSQASRLVAAPLPAEGREPGFSGAVGQDMSLSVVLQPSAARQRDAVSLRVFVRGSGNVALWPEPRLVFPRGVRVYAEGTEEQAKVAQGWMGGGKLFRYLLIPDSAGTMVLRVADYPFFDPLAGRYRTASAPAVTLVVSPVADGAVARAEPPPVRLRDRAGAAARLLAALPAGGWWGILALAPLLALARRPRRRRPPPTSRGSPPRDAIQAAEERLHRRLTGILGGVSEPRVTAAALHDAGIPRDTADRVASLLERYRAARFSDAPGDTAELLRDTELVLKRLQGTNPRRGRSLRQRITLGLLLSIIPAAARAQATPSQLYQAGAYRLAAAGFAREVVQRPEIANRWYNLGAARYRAGADAGALAAWAVAARLAPRDRGIRRALALVPPAANVTGIELWAAPLTPAELRLLAGVLWLLGWGAVAVERRFRGRWAVLLAGALLASGSGEALRHWYARPRAVVIAGQVLRLAPHERAPGVGELLPLEVVRPLAERRGWIRLESAGGEQGWVLASELEPIAPPAP